MRVTCKFSDVTFEVQNFGNVYVPSAEHPLMSDVVSTGTLVNDLFGAWMHGELNKEESRILFVALLKRTGLVIFDTAANPAPHVVHLNMEPLAKLCSFKDVLTNPKSMMPGYKISALNRNCKGINEWLHLCHDRISSWRQNFADQRLRDRTDKLEENFLRLVRSSISKDRARALDHLAHWAMIASDAPKDKWEEWIGIFKLQGLDIYKTKPEKIEELWGHLQMNMARAFSHHSPILGAETMTHITVIRSKYAKGISHFLGIDANELDFIDPDLLSQRSFKLLDDTAEEKAEDAIAQTAPLQKPEEKNFAKRFEYLRARAAYDIALRVQDRKLLEEKVRKEAEKLQQAKLQEDALDNINDADDTDIGDIGISLPKDLEQDYER